MAEATSEKFKLRDEHYGITKARLLKGTHSESKSKKSKKDEEDEE